MAYANQMFPRSAVRPMGGSVGMNRQNMVRRAMAGVPGRVFTEGDIPFNGLQSDSPTIRAMQANQMPAMRHMIGETMGWNQPGQTMASAYGMPSGRPIQQGIMPEGGPMAGQPFQTYNASAPAGPMAARNQAFLNAMNQPVADDPKRPFTGSPIARQGSVNFPGTPIGRMGAYETRAQVRSMYGRDGDANWYASSPMPRQPLGEVLSQTDRGMLDRDANAGAFGTLGGSSDRLARMKALINQAPDTGPAHRPWNPELMAQIERQSADRTNPAMIAQRRQLEMMGTPEYQANRARQMEYTQNRDQRLAQTRGQLGMARGIAQSQARGMRLTPIQESFLAQVKEARQGKGLDGTQIAGRGLNSKPAPFSDLRGSQVAKVDLSPEREQQLLGILDGIGPDTPLAEVNRIRGSINPGELDALKGKLKPGVLSRIGGEKAREWERLQENADRIAKGEFYEPPQVRKENARRAYNEYGGGWAN